MTARHSFADAPVRVYWEITRACSLACLHCRAEAAPEPFPGQLDTAEGLQLLAQLAGAEPRPHVILTGGDPLTRGDLFLLIAEGRRLGLSMSVSPSATPLLTADAITRLRDAGVAAISLSLDGSDADRHDGLRGVPGCFARTLEAARQARRVGLPFQVNTLVSRSTLRDLPAVETLVRELRADRWSLFFLVTVGRGAELEAVSTEEGEELLAWLADRAVVPGPPVITTTEAPHYRRVTLLRRSKDDRRPVGHGAGMRDGNGVMFIAHDGDVSPSGFLPLSAGNVKDADPIAIYRESPLFRSLRDVDGFEGKCGICELRAVCGGSRARAWAASGSPTAEDPLCGYQPRAGQTAAQAVVTPR